MILTSHDTPVTGRKPRRRILKGPFNVDGKEFGTIKELAEHTGMKRVTLSWRLHHWGDLQKALTQELHHTREAR